jgi:hypothetical protein
VGNGATRLLAIGGTIDKIYSNSIYCCSQSNSVASNFLLPKYPDVLAMAVLVFSFDDLNLKLTMPHTTFLLSISTLGCQSQVVHRDTVLHVTEHSHTKKK